MAEKMSTFLRIFGDSPVLRVLDFLIIHNEFDYSMTDIARLSGVGYSTLKQFWPRLEKGRIVTNTRFIGKALMYKLNESNPAVKHFIEMYWATTKIKTHSLLKQKAVAIQH